MNHYNRLYECTKTILIAALCCMSMVSWAQKPKWVNNTPVALNSTYRFVEVTSYGTTEQAALMDAQTMLAQNEQLRSAVIVSVDAGQLTETDGVVTEAGSSETMRDRTYVNMTSRGKEYRLQASLVDHWVEERDANGVRMRSLYQVAVSNHPDFDNTRLSTNYGATPIFMSIIPGLGQVYKGSTVKGILMFAGTALCAGGILLCENQRADYRNKVLEQPKFAQTYNTKANNWETGRNICIGATAAVWLYNIIDAATAKGARRVIVERKDGTTASLQLQPSVDLNSVGLALICNF